MHTAVKTIGQWQAASSFPTLGGARNQPQDLKGQSSNRLPILTTRLKKKSW